MYLSWIALDEEYQSYNYFSILFEYYNTLIRRLRSEFKLDLEGAAIIIRRMRPIIWNLFNDEKKCPTTINKPFTKDNPRYKFTFLPGELIKKGIQPKQDHLLIQIKNRL